MSMPFMCGAAPSSFTVPVILPSPAAFTFWPRMRAAQQTNVATAVRNATLDRFFIEKILSLASSMFAMPVMASLLSRCRSIGIHRLEAQALGNGLGLAGLRHQSSQVKHEIPGLVGLDVICEGRHGRAVETGHEDLVDITIGVAALGPRSLGEVVRLNGTAKIILQSGGGRSVGLALHAMALPALGAGKHFAAGLNALGSDLGLGRNGDRGAGLIAHKARREVLDPGDEIGSLLLGEGAPLRHVGTVEAASDGVEQILVGGQRSSRSGTALENPKLKIARLRVDPGEAFAVAIPQRAMADDAVAAIVSLALLGVAGEVTNVTFHA